MKRFISATSIAAMATLFAVSAPANAADVYGRDEVPESSYAQPDYNPFAGWYFGLQGGGQFTNIDINDQFDGIGADGLIGGAHAGYNMQMGSLVTGPYVEGGFSNVNVDINFGAGASGDLLSQDWYAQGGWLVGVEVYDKTLVFGRAGYEYAKWSSDFFSETVDVYSFVLGGGIETMIAANVSIGLTADYLIPHEIEVDSTNLTDLLDASEQLRAMARITYRQ
jgi:outer membrane immunogenic protein